MKGHDWGREGRVSVPFPVHGRTTHSQSRQLAGVGKVEVFSFPAELLGESLFSLLPRSLC